MNHVGTLRNSRGVTMVFYFNDNVKNAEVVSELAIKYQQPFGKPGSLLTSINR